MGLDNVCVAERELVFLFFGMFRKLCGMNLEQFGLRIGISKQNVNQYEEPGKRLLDASKCGDEKIVSLYKTNEKIDFHALRNEIAEYASSNAEKKGNLLKTNGLRNIPLYIAFRQFFDYECRNTESAMKLSILKRTLNLLDVFSEAIKNEQWDEQKKIFETFINLSTFLPNSSSTIPEEVYKKCGLLLQGKETDTEPTEEDWKAFEEWRKKEIEGKWYLNYQQDVQEEWKKISKKKEECDQENEFYYDLFEVGVDYEKIEKVAQRRGVAPSKLKSIYHDYMMMRQKDVEARKEYEKLMKCIKSCE